MPNQKNIKTVENLKEKIKKAKSIVFAEYTGLNVNNINDLRAKIKEADGDTSIAKNTLTSIALNEENIDTKPLKDTLQGQTAMILGYEDAITPIKALFEFIKEFKLPVVKAGIVDGKLTTAAEIETLSELPSKEQLLGMVVSRMKSPINGIVNVLKGSQRKFVYALSAIAEKKQN